MSVHLKPKRMMLRWMGLGSVGCMPTVMMTATFSAAIAELESGPFGGVVVRVDSE